MSSFALYAGVAPYANEIKERSVVVLVGGLQCGDVLRSCFPSSSKIRAPSKAIPTGLNKKKIGRRAGKAAIAIGERMYEDESMVKADGNFGRVPRLVLNLGFHVFKQCCERHTDLLGSDTNR